MRDVSYVDRDGRNWATRIPDSAPDSDAPLGILIGPPSLQDLGLPKDLEIALHNQLFFRKIFTSGDVKKRRVDVIGAIRDAYKIDAEKIYVHYLKLEGNL